MNILKTISTLDSVILDVTYEKKLNNNEHSLLIFFLNKLEENPDSEFFQICSDEIKTLINTNKTEDLLNTLNKFIHKYIRYDFIKNNKVILSGVFPLITSVQFEDNLLFFHFNKELLHSFSADSIFYKFHLSTLIKFRLVSSVKLYHELINHIDNSSSFEVPLEKLKKLFDTNDSYGRFYDFEKNILSLSIEEINNYSNFHIDYEKIKIGEGKTSKVISLKFNFSNKNINKTIQEYTQIIALIQDKVNDIDLIKNSIMHYISEYSYTYTLNNVSFALNNSQGDFDQFLIKALKCNYHDSYFSLLDEKNSEPLKILVDYSGHFYNTLTLQSELYKQLNKLKFSYKFEFVQALHKLRETNKLEFSDESIKISVEYNKIGDSYIKVYALK